MDPTPLPALDPELIRRTTREVLSRPDFPVELPSGRPKGLDDLLEIIGSVLGAISTWAAANPGIAWTVFAILSILLLALIAHIIYLSLGTGTVHSGARQANKARYELLEGAGNNWQEGLAAASQALEGGELRRSVWIAHRVLLGLLDEQGAIRFAGHKTNEAYLKECQSSHPWSETLRTLTSLYDQVIYGHLPVDAGQLLQLIARLRTFDPQGETHRSHASAGGEA